MKAFAIDRVLGEGASGRVYAASWRGRPVALKVLREERTPTDRDRARFLSEATRLRSVDHPGVVKLVGVGLLPDGRPFLAMERLEGHTLADRIAGGPMPLCEARGIFAQIAAAVSALHARGLIHRDIKPDNVFLAGSRAVLLDLGIATSEETPASTVTREGIVLGTPAFMAPERFFGAPAGVATDVYELAVLFYAMVTGRLPWDHVADLAGRLGPPPPSDRGVRLGATAESTLMRALSTRAEIRPSVAALAEAIARSVKKPPTGSAMYRRRGLHPSRLPAGPRRAQQLARRAPVARRAGGPGRSIPPPLPARVLEGRR